MWRGKDYQDWSDLVVQAPPLYIQEKVHPKVLIDDLLRAVEGRKAQESGSQIDLFADFNGVAEGADRTDFYQHDQNWTNRMILGDSLQVMASLAEREGLRGKVQCIYIDPPYGIKFNSNFQWSTTSRDVKDGNAGHITREPEQVKAFRDTWRDGIHSYLTYLRDRLTVARDLLTESGSVFVQIGDENVHRVRDLMDEVFGEENFVSSDCCSEDSGRSSASLIPGTTDYLLWYAKIKSAAQIPTALHDRRARERRCQLYAIDYSRLTAMQTNDRSESDRCTTTGSALDDVRSLSQIEPESSDVLRFRGRPFECRGYSQSLEDQSRWALQRLANGRSHRTQRGSTLQYVRFLDDFPLVNS